VVDNMWQEPGERVRALRRRLGLRQTDLAALLGVSNVTVNRWEHGRMRPAPAVWERLLRMELRGLDEARGPHTVAAARRTRRPGNLPLAATRFVGRDTEVLALRQLLAAEFLVTLTGTGGVGKTRLAVEVGRGLVDRFPDGIWFADLAVIADRSLVAPAVARILGVREAGRQPVVARIVAACVDWHFLLILDNCEQVRAGCAALVGALRANLPGLRVLATSRAALDVPGETVWPVPPLSAVHAADLFRDRARRHRPDLILDEREEAAVAEICRRLDGLPLAIELAAVRTHVFSAAQIVDRLSRRFELLRTDRCAARHRALDTAIAWSYDLLSPDERALFRRLGVFAGSFDLASAEAICEPEGAGPEDQGAGEPSPDPPTVLDLIDRLARQSMVVAEEDASGGDVRYRLLASLAAFARERLRDEGLEQTFAGRHAEYYAGFAKNAAVGWPARLDREEGNLAAALEWALAAAPTLAARLAAAIWPSWRRRALSAEGAAVLERVIAACAELTTPEIVTVLIGAAILRAQLGEYGTASRLAEEALRRAREIGFAKGEANAMGAVALVVEERGDLPSAEAAYRRALALWTELDDPGGRVAGLNGLGRIAANRGDLAGAETSFAEAWSLTRARGDAHAEAGALLNLADVAARTGRAAVAGGCFERALPIIRALGDPHLLATVLGKLAEVRLTLGNAARAVELAAEALAGIHGTGDLSEQAGILFVFGVALDAAGQPHTGLDRLRDALALHHRVGNLGHAARTIDAIAGLLVRLGAAEKAARALGAADAIRAAAAVSPSLLLDAAAVAEASRAALGDEAFAAAWGAGRALTPDRAIAELLRLDGSPGGEMLAPTSRDVPSETPKLTARQTEVLRLAAAGCTNWAIAAALSVGVRTVEQHLTAAYTALGTRGRADAVARALAAGLLAETGEVSSHIL
jgi:predicted ATPase/DNA-binding CsgD family transcriptional regulator/DNA-binding XRE family transcriptional regulator/Tfp pilus assembly protein PilF